MLFLNTLTHLSASSTVVFSIAGIVCLGCSQSARHASETINPNSGQASSSEVQFSTRVKANFAKIEIQFSHLEDAKKSQKLVIQAQEIKAQTAFKIPTGRYSLSTLYYDSKNQIILDSNWCLSQDSKNEPLDVRPGLNQIDLSNACENKDGQDASTRESADAEPTANDPIPNENSSTDARQNAQESENPVADNGRKLNDGSGGIRMIGDSLFTHGNFIQRSLSRIIGQNIINHAIPGTVMRQISAQYAAIRTQKPRIVIMDGGGNDVLGQREACSIAMTAPCKLALDAALESIKKTWETMAQDGVHHVVYMKVYYPEQQSWTEATSGYATAGRYTEAVDYASKRLDELCKTQKIDCLLVDPRPALSRLGKYTDDGIHPTAAAGGLIAETIAKAMEERQMLSR